MSVPGDPNVYYAGSATGGVFKTTDGGTQWTSVFHSEPVQSVGSLAVAASDPNVVWAGTGETFICGHISVGDGIYKSTDAGKTWTNMGLDKTAGIGRIVIDPHNDDIVLACALGHAYGPQPERGVFRTADGGKTWNRTLFVDENTAAPTSQPIPTTRAFSMPACGSSNSTRGTGTAAARAAAPSQPGAEPNRVR